MSNTCNIFPQSPQNLESYDVFIEENVNDPQFFDIQLIPELLTHGKHMFAIGMLDNHPEYSLKLGSEIKIEIKDYYGTIIYHELIPVGSISRSGVGFIWLREDLAGKFDLDNLEDNISTMTILGELDGVPPQWNGIYNVRMNVPFVVRRFFVNNSPLYFFQQPIISVQEDFESDVDNNFYSRSFASFKLDQLKTIGGNCKYGEVSYLTISASTSDRVILDTFQITSSVEVLRDTISNVGITGVLDDTGMSNQTSNNQWIGNFSSSLQVNNWKIFGGQASGDISMLPFALLQTAATKNAVKLFRYAQDYEEYTIQFKLSGSGDISIKTSPFQTDLTSSLDSYGDDTANIKTAFTKSFTKFNPNNNLTWTSSNFNTATEIISGSGTAILKGEFCIPSGTYASIWLNCKDTTDNASWADVTIKPKELAGTNPPFYYHKIQLPSERRDDNYDFQLRFLNPNMEVAQDINVSGMETLATTSNKFTGSPKYFEKDDNLMLGALSSPDYMGYTEANSSPKTGSSGFLIYSGSVLTSSDSTNLYHNGGVGFELAGGANSGSLRFNTITGKLEVTGSFQTTGDGTFGGTISASAGDIGGWTIGSDALFYVSASYSKTTLSGSKGTINLYSGSNLDEVLQIASDISEDSQDPLASPGMFVTDGIVFLKRNSGSMPVGSKSGVSDFIQQGTRIKPGFLNIQNSGSNEDIYQRLSDNGSIFKIRSINQNTSGSSDNTIGIHVDRYTDKTGPGMAANIYGIKVDNSVTTGSSYGLAVKNTIADGNTSKQYLLHLDAASSGDILGLDVTTYINNSDFEINVNGSPFLFVSASTDSPQFKLGNGLSATDSGFDEVESSFKSIARVQSGPNKFNNNPMFIGTEIFGSPVTPSIFVSASNDVGINTLDPQYPLHVDGDIYSSGNIIANQYVVSSSVTYMTQSFSSGSTIFGDTIDDTHQFTGSVFISGSLSVDDGSSFAYLHTQAVAAKTWTINHNLNWQYLSVEIYDNNDNIIIPHRIVATDANTTTVGFLSPVAGKGVVTYAGGTVGSVTDFDGTYPGSTFFGSTTANVHERTGSLLVSGSNHSIFGDVAIGIHDSTLNRMLDVSGSTHFGNSLSDIHEFTGSLLVSGSIGTHKIHGTTKIMPNGDNNGDLVFQAGNAFRIKDDYALFWTGSNGGHNLAYKQDELGHFYFKYKSDSESNYTDILKLTHSGSAKVYNDLYVSSSIYSSGSSYLGDNLSDRHDISGSTTLHGGVSYKVDTITSTINLDETHHVIFTNFGSETTINLPLAASHPGRQYIVRAKSNSQKCVVSRTGGDTIDDGESDTTVDISADKTRTFISDGSSIWYTVSDIGS